MKALDSRYPKIAEALNSIQLSKEYFVRAESDQILLAVSGPGGMTILPSVLPPAAARQIGAQLCPQANCDQAIVVAGEDIGWLWNGLWRLPSKSALAAG